MEVLHYFGAALGLGMIVIGAGFGISKFTAAAAEGIARQPAAAASITGATMPIRFGSRENTIPII